MKKYGGYTLDEIQKMGPCGGPPTVNDQIISDLCLDLLEEKSKKERLEARVRELEKIHNEGVKPACKNCREFSECDVIKCTGFVPNSESEAGDEDDGSL